jgi:hypothetical protein
MSAQHSTRALCTAAVVAASREASQGPAPRVDDRAAPDHDAQRQLGRVSEVSPISTLSRWPEPDSGM